MAEKLESPTTVEYKDIPGFRVSTVPGHEGKLIFGLLGGKPAVCMKGRLHLYEGYTAQEVTFPIRVMRLLGAEVLVVTNAAGGLNEKYTRGDVVVMKDHVNLVGMTGLHPLTGPNEDRFGPRFPAMTVPYDIELRKLALDTAKELNMMDFVREGVYMCISGPSYETPTESRLARLVGADTIGMSTAPETVVARHCGMRVLGVSLVTNMVIMDNDVTSDGPTHEEVMETADRRSKDLQKLVARVVEKIKLS